MSTSAHAAKPFAFDRVFELDPKSGDDVFIRIRAEEIRDREAAAYARGEEDGLAREAALQTAAIDRCAAVVADLAAKLDEAAAAHKRFALEIALAAVDRISRALSDEDAARRIADTLEECLEAAPSLSAIDVSVSPAVRASAEPALREAAERAGFEGRMTFTEDPDLEAADARFAWADGAMIRTRANLVADIEATVERRLAAEELELGQLDLFAAPAAADTTGDRP